MSVQKFFGGKFNGQDQAATQQARSAPPDYFARRTAFYGDASLWEDQGGTSRHDHDDPPGTIRCSLEIGNPALVMNMRGTWDVLAFCPMRHLATGLSGEKALAVASAARAKR